MKKQLDLSHTLVSSIYLFLHNSFSLSVINYCLAVRISPPPSSSLLFSSFPLCAFYVRIILWSLERLARFQEYNCHYHFGLFSWSLAAVSFSSLKYFSCVAWTLSSFVQTLSKLLSQKVCENVVTKGNLIIRQMTVIQPILPVVVLSSSFSIDELSLLCSEQFL